ncbi:hypothetical protein P8452_38351 [Trifolium repens]|nr:hypothetical protein P8452_38351 [Trifolium repens]
MSVDGVKTLSNVKFQKPAKETHLILTIPHRSITPFGSFEERPFSLRVSRSLLQSLTSPSRRHLCNLNRI